MLKVGVFGAGHLGKIHMQQWKEIPNVELVGFFDPDDANAASAIEQYNVTRYDTADALIQACQALDIVSTTSTHYDIAKKCLLNSRHLFIEKPLANTLEQGRELVKLVKEANIKCQVGHVERYNPAYLALAEESLKPMFIEGHRLAQFNPRGTDVSVILDLMIHDIDIVMHLVKSPVRRISASGVSVISETADIANISLKKMRKLRIFQRDAYISLDFLEKKTEVVRIKDSDANKGMFDFPIDMPNGDKKILSVQLPEVVPSNAIRSELADFADAVMNDKPVRVSVYDGYQAMDVAHQILKKMSLHNELHNV